MNGITCEAVRILVVGAVRDPGAAAAADLAAHLQHCEACRTWLAAYEAGEHLWREEDAEVFADRVVARTSAVDALVAELPTLAEMDPGLGFTERVLQRTSRAQGWRARRAGVLAACRALVQRPRFAWEAAYVATLCLVLMFGGPVAAWEWSASKVQSVAAGRLGSAVRTVQADLAAWQVHRGADAPAPVAGAAPGDDGAAGVIARAWQRGIAWLERLGGAVWNALADAVQAFADWLRGPPAAAPPGQPTEPGGTGARSSQ